MATTKMNIYQKLLEVKKRVPYLQKDKQGHNYSYATPSNVLSTLNPILNDLGLLLKPEIIGNEISRIFQKPKSVDIYVDGKKESRVIDVHETLFNLTMKMTWVDTETGEKDENLWFTSGVNGDEKGLGSSLTYCERYFMLKYFNIPTDDDDPDAFQDKHLSDDELQKKTQSKIDKEFDEAIKEIDESKSNSDLTKVKLKYPQILKHLTKKMIEKSESFKTDEKKSVDSPDEKVEKVSSSANIEGVLKKPAKVVEKIKKPDPIPEIVVKEEPKKETLESILETEEIEEAEPITIESITEIGQKFTNHELMVKWWNENLPAYKRMFNEDEMIAIKTNFNNHYKSIAPKK